ncbi:hypothetical protein D9758_011735 [Tetrapyrgos nigripes]|uniref:Uncharacterized protein n=1 Tax=Tetrapyrgos nigripes TaxID=182062 RepID=A0A8H5LML5_9AGAR|nr:hypothetical protein D9758_011735 [Tetrapyrgos nigripes]
MPDNQHTRSSSGTFLSEEYIQNAFHSYLKSSLTQAKLERLLDEEVLSSAEGDLMITGPALCLYFAALRCTTNPPSVPLPRHQKDSSSPSPTDLSPENCPPTFRGFLTVWGTCVPKIQALTPEQQHDLARIICALDPLNVTLPDTVYGIAADLRAVAIEISQRRSFQNRYASDLQAALDSSTPSTSQGPSSSSTSHSHSHSGSDSPGSRPPSGGLKVKASFVPPPSYEESSPTHSANSSSSPSPNRQTINLPQWDLPPQDGSHLSPFSPTFEPSGAGPSSSRPNNASNRHSVGSTVSTATSATLNEYDYDDDNDNDKAAASPPFPIPQIPIGNHGTYYPPRVSVPPPLPPKDQVGTTRPLHVHKKDSHRRTLSATSISQPSPTSTSPSHSHRYSHSYSATSTSTSPRPPPPPSPTPSHHSAHSSTPSTPSIITPTTPSIDIIRETLYAALADVLSRHPALRAMLKLDPPRAYFGAVALGILEVASRSVVVDGGEDGGAGGDVTVIGVLGHELTLSSCPDELKPFMKELGVISRGVRKMSDDDDERAVKAMQQGLEADEMPEPRMQVVKRILEEGVGGVQSVQSLARGKSDTPSTQTQTQTQTQRRHKHKRTPSPSNKTLTFANRINALALGMVGLKGFRERQGEVFSVLSAAGGGGGF